MAGKDEAINNLKSEKAQLEKEKQELEEKVNESTKQDVHARIDKLANEGYIKKEKAEGLKNRFANDPDGLKAFEDALVPAKGDMQNYMQPANKGGSQGNDGGNTGGGAEDGIPSMREMEKKDPAKLEDIQQNNPTLFAKMYEKEYGYKPE